MFHLRVESITVVILTICVFLSFYFAFLSLQTVDDALKKQLVTLAAYTLITGVIMFACLTISFVIKKAFPKMEAQLRSRNEQSEQVLLTCRPEELAEPSSTNLLFYKFN